MIIIQRGIQNENICFTLNEKATLSSPFFLFVLTNLTTKTKKRFIANDLSSFKSRYNKFTITESGSEVLTSGTVELKPTGFWKYEIYEQLSDTNLDETASDNKIPIEVGICRVKGEVINKNKYDGQPKTRKAYGRGS